MTKIITITIIIFFLWYIFSQKLSRFKYNTNSNYHNNQQIITLNLPTFIQNQLWKKTLVTVGTGAILLVIILLIATRFKIILICLPLSFYLIGQFFVFQNHIKVIRRQKANYNVETNELLMTTSKGKEVLINLNNSSVKVREIKPVQKNNGISLGYFEIYSKEGSCYIPYVLSKNRYTNIIFNTIQKLNKESHTKVFPLI